MLFLNAEDIENALDKNDLIDQMEEAMLLFETGKLSMPPRNHLEHGENTLLIMPCFGQTYFSTKLVTVFPGNRGTDFPVVNGMVLLNDIKTGEPVAMLDGQALTGIRTGAVGAVGIRHLSPETPHPQVLGIVGAGVQGFHQVRFAAAARPLEAVFVHNRDSAKIPAFIKKLEPELDGIPLKQAGSIEELLEASQTVILATSSSSPVLPEKPELLKGLTLLGIGSYRPDMQEFPRAAFEVTEQMFLDTDHARHESGDVIRPLEHGWISDNKVETMGKFLFNRKKRKSLGELSGESLSEPLRELSKESFKKSLYKKTTIYKSVGVAAFDLAAAIYIFKNAQKKGLGQRLNL